jgi:hypothetical protein
MKVGVIYGLFGCFVWLFCGPAFGFAQEWQRIPKLPTGPTEPMLAGVTAVGQLERGSGSMTVDVVISGAKNSKLYTLGIYVHDLPSIVTEKELRPYMGPDLGREAADKNMIEIAVAKNNTIQKWNFPLLVAFGGNFPQWNWSKKGLLLSASISSKSGKNSLLEKMSSGFDRAVIVVGSGVFKQPIEVTIQGNNFDDAIKAVKIFVGAESNPNQGR